MSATAPPVDLRPDHWAIVREVLQRHIPDRKVLAFGSRATWTAKDYSDLDLAILGDETLPLSTTSALAESFEESDLPFKVDLVDWARIDDDFREIIRRDGVPMSMFAGNRVAQAPGRWSPSVRSSSNLDWSRMTLGDCIEINDAAYRLGEAWPFVNYLDTGNITENRVFEIQHFVTGKDKLPSRARRKVRSGDIVYSTVRPNQKHFGVMKNIPENFLASTGFSVVRAKNGIAHTDFVYWFLTQDHIIDQLQTIAEHSTSAYPSIRPSDIEGLELDLPPLVEQRAIAYILGRLDNKIDLNRRMNQTLEAMAQAIFEDWFVDFGPVRAKMEGRDTGLSRRITDLFPDRFVDSELGEIPEGWINYRLNELTEHHTLAVTPSGHPGAMFEHFSIPAYDKDRMPAIDRGDSIKSNKTVVPSDAVLLSKLNPDIPRVWMPGVGNGVLQICSTEFLAFTANHQANRSLLFCLFTSIAFRETLQSMVTGTSKSHQRVQPAALKQRGVLSGTPVLFSEFGEIAEAILNQAVGRFAESQCHAVLRDTLLPRLVSGEIRTRALRETMTETADKVRRAIGGTP